jgi:uncharacterized membrane protein YfcA
MNARQPIAKIDDLPGRTRRTLKSARPSLLALEARLMFDGAAAVTEPAHAAEPVAAPTPDTHVDRPSDLAATNTTSEVPTSSAPRAIAFVDTKVFNWQSLVAQLPPEVEVITLDPARDELSQIVSALSGRHDISALHIISHGEAGALILGGQKITSDTLLTRQADLATIGKALGADGDILLYGCDIGQGTIGQAFINAIAGGGTLVSFPVLMALGLPPVAANVTNTVALCPGYFGGVFAQRKDFAAQKKRLYTILPLSMLGGIAGGLILLNTGEKAFNGIVPYLILLACVLLAIQVPVKKWMLSRTGKTHGKMAKRAGAATLLILASLYGGYFGAGVSVIVIAILGLIYDDSLTELNVLKQAISFSINVSAAIYFSFTGKVDWTFALIMMVGAVSGGVLGGRFAGTIKPGLLRWIVILTGCTAALIYFLK